MKAKVQPDWVCRSCGEKYSSHDHKRISTYHLGVCDVCKQDKCAVTEARDYGYLEEGWEKECKRNHGRQSKKQTDK